MTNKSVSLVVENVSLQSIPNKIKIAFKKFEKQLIRANDVRDFEVNTEETKNIAESKIRSINKLKAAIEEKRKELKEPIIHIGNIIQNEAKVLDNELSLAKSILNKNVTQYKELKLAQLKLEEEKRRKEEEKELQRKKELLSRISSMLNTFTSLLFGGEVPSKDGELIYKRAPETVEDLKKVKNMIQKNFPDFDLFQEYSTKVAQYYEEYIDDIDAYIKYLENAEYEKVKILKAKYYQLCNRNENDYKKNIKEEEKKIEKKIEDEYKSAGKNIREYLKFDVVDISMVPDRLKVVDEQLVRDYIRDNKKRVTDMTKNGKGSDVIPGISFRIERKNVTV